MKKYIFLILTILSFACATQNEGTQFKELSFEKALKKAEKSGKPLFIDCYTKTCAPCKYMIENIFPLKECGDYFNANFISIKKDMEEGDGLEIAKKYNIEMYPTYLILNADGTEICRELRSVSSPDRVNDFIDIIKSALHLAEMSEKFDSGERDATFMKEYLNTLRSKDRNQLMRVMNKLMLPMSVKELASPENWKLIKDELHQIENPLFRKIFNERKELANILGKEEVYNKLASDYKEDYRMGRMMITNFDIRIQDIALLEEEGYPELISTRYALIFKNITQNQQEEQIDKIIQIITKELPKWEESDSKIVLAELRGIERSVTGEKRKELVTALNSLLKKTKDNDNIRNVQNAIKALSE